MLLLPFFVRNQLSDNRCDINAATSQGLALLPEAVLFIQGLSSPDPVRRRTGSDSRRASEKRAPGTKPLGGEAPGENLLEAYPWDP